MIRALAFLHQRIREAALGDAPDEIVDPRLRRNERAVRSLPDMQHEVFRLARFERLNHAAIAYRLGITEQHSTEHLVLAIEMILRSLDRQRRRCR